MKNMTLARIIRASAAPVALSVAASVASAALAAGANYSCSINPTGSSLVQTTGITAPFSGTLIGNYNATTNPTGTLTRPGLFGGSGNLPVNYTASFAVNGNINSVPSGAWVASIDLETLQVTIRSLSMNLLGGTSATLPATVNINFQTFRTFAPNSTFFGGFNVPVPVGDASITELRAVQTADATGALVPQKGNRYTLAVAVPVNVILSADVLGSPVAESSVSPGVLPLSGTVTVTDTGVSLALSISNQSSETQPITDGAFTDQPIALPTVLPAGNTANLLMSGTVTQVTLSTNLNATLAATGTRQAVPGDLDGDFLVNSSDLGILLTSWGQPGVSDLNADGTTDSADLAIVLTNWTA
jgi:hypothetical protein